MAFLLAIRTSRAVPIRLVLTAHYRNSPISRNGKLIQHKFRLGADLKEAKRREQKLLELWGQVEKDSASQPIVWTPFVLDLGKQIAKRKFQIEVPRKPHDSPQAYARYLHRLQRHYPMVSLIVEEEEACVSGAAANRSTVQEQIGELQQQIAISPSSPVVDVSPCAARRGS